MGQWKRQHEQVNSCFRETVSVHPTWSTQSSGRSRHHSSERRKSIHNAGNTGVVPQWKRRLLMPPLWGWL